MSFRQKSGSRTSSSGREDSEEKTALEKVLEPSCKE